MGLARLAKARVKAYVANDWVLDGRDPAEARAADFVRLRRTRRDRHAATKEGRP